jgi:hypothetical protein
VCGTHVLNSGVDVSNDAICRYEVTVNSSALGNAMSTSSQSNDTPAPVYFMIVVTKIYNNIVFSSQVGIRSVRLQYNFSWYGSWVGLPGRWIQRVRRC